MDSYKVRGFRFLSFWRHREANTVTEVPRYVAKNFKIQSTLFTSKNSAGIVWNTIPVLFLLVKVLIGCRPSLPAVGDPVLLPVYLKETKWLSSQLLRVLLTFAKFHRELRPRDIAGLASMISTRRCSASGS